MLNDGTAEGGAELVKAEAGFRNAQSVIEPVVGIEGVVAEEFKGVAVEFVGAGFNGGIHDATEKITELRLRILGDQVEFLDGVGAG